jgi:hypothetical protein
VLESYLERFLFPGVLNGEIRGLAVFVDLDLSDEIQRIMDHVSLGVKGT